jgi:hypothetical protein
MRLALYRRDEPPSAAPRAFWVLTSIRDWCTVAIVKVIPPGCRDDIRVGFGSPPLWLTSKSAGRGLSRFGRGTVVSNDEE